MFHQEHKQQCGQMDCFITTQGMGCNNYALLACVQRQFLDENGTQTINPYTSPIIYTLPLKHATCIHVHVTIEKYDSTSHVGMVSKKHGGSNGCITVYGCNSAMMKSQATLLHVFLMEHASISLWLSPWCSLNKQHQGDSPAVPINVLQHCAPPRCS